MDEYTLIPVTKTHITKITDLYNSNTVFLKAHLGVAFVTEEFVRKDFLKSKSQGFQIFLIEDSPGEFAGFCDYKPGAETYLSILLIDGKRKGVGIGKKVYTQLENTLRTEGACAVRIDVLYEYAENALGFWEKQGFVATEKIAMDWEGHKSTAIKMIKIL